MAFLTRYELHFGLERVSIVKTKNQKVCGDGEEKPRGDGFPPAEIRLNSCEKINTVCFCIVSGD